MKTGTLHTLMTSITILILVAGPTHAKDIFVDSFESADWSATNPEGFNWRLSTLTSIVTETHEVFTNSGIVNVTKANAHSFPGKIWTPKTGTHSMRFPYPSGVEWVQENYGLGTAMKDVWIQFWLMVPVNFTYPPKGNVNKLFAIYSDAYSHNGTGSTVWVGMHRQNTTDASLSFSYSAGNNTSSGSALQIQPFFTINDRGRWMHMAIHVKTESNDGSSDGVVQTYRRWQGESAYTELHNASGLPIKLPADSSPDGLMLGYILGWHQPYVEHSEWLVDDFVVWDPSDGSSPLDNPILTGGLPSGELPSGTTSATMTLITNKNTTCKYDTTLATAYVSMINTFGTTGGLTHLEPLAGLSNGSSYTYYVKCQDGFGNINTIDYAIPFAVSDGSVSPPVLENATPSSTLVQGTTSTSMTLTSNENATCKYDTLPGVAYASMINTFATTGALTHAEPLTGLADNNFYTYYVKCQDALGDSNTSDYIISFGVSDGFAPILANAAPLGALPSGTTSTSMTLTSNENATCKYDTLPGVAYASMVNTFATTGALTHAEPLTGLADNSFYTHYVKCQNTLGDSNTSDYIISFGVSDGFAPILANAAPSGTLPSGTTSTSMTLTSNENATCKYDTLPGVAYASMTNTFSTTGALTHAEPLTSLSDGNVYVYYVKCEDATSDSNIQDYIINFFVMESLAPSAPMNLMVK